MSDEVVMVVGVLMEKRKRKNLMKLDSIKTSAVLVRV